MYSILGLRCNAMNRNKHNAWLFHRKTRVGVGGVAVILQQHYASNAAWSLPELNSNLRRGGVKEWRESRGGTENGLGEGEKMRECFCVTKVKKKQARWGEKNAWCTPVYSRAEKWQIYLPHKTQTGHFFFFFFKQAWFQNRLHLQVTFNFSSNLFIEPGSKL